MMGIRRRNKVPGALALLLLLGAAACHTADQGTRSPAVSHVTMEDSETDPAPGSRPRSASTTWDLEPGICRHGAVFRTIRGSGATPQLCANICDRLMDCMAFTYMDKRALPDADTAVADEGARCELKLAVPDPTPDDADHPLGCVSWVNPRARKQIAVYESEGFELRTNRPGADFRSIVLDKADPRLCQKACQNLIDCKAFTYERSTNDFQDTVGVCHLKDEVPEAIHDQDCCISGVK